MKAGKTEIKILRSDILSLDCDVLVIPATQSLRMDTGLGKAVKERGGRAIEEDVLKMASALELGNVLSTTAGKLKAKHILHAVLRDSGPVREEVLRKSVALSFVAAADLEAKCLVLPALGCEQGDFPPIGSAKIIAQEILKHVREARMPLEEIIVCLADESLFKIFEQTIRGYIDHIQDDLGKGPYVTVDAIIERPEGIILIERSNPPYGWALPGGFVDYGESLETAVVREVKEETGLDFVDVRQFHTYSDPDRDPRFHTISTVFIGRGEGTPQFGSDAKGLKVVPHEELLNLDYAFDHKKVIQDYLNYRNPQEAG